MKPLLLALLLATLCATGYGQTIKSLGYNTTNGIVFGPTSGVLLFTNEADFPTVSGGTVAVTSQLFVADTATLVFDGEGPENWRSALGLGATWLTNTNVTNFRTAIGLGATNSVSFASLTLTDGGVSLGAISTNSVLITIGNNGFSIEGNTAGQPLFEFVGTNNLVQQARNDFGLGATNTVTFAGLTNNGDITINQTTTNNGLLYIRRTNNEAFLGLANLIASNNTTISNETLFRVGTAEATNKSAQFGFRSTNTNGEGVAVFSVFGYNALMMIGADASTNAVIYSGGGTNNEVMTLIKSGATEFARPISFSTTAHAAATRTNLALGAANDPTFRDVSVRDLSIVGGSGGKIVYPQTNTAPADTTNAATWIQVNVGTNSYRVPLYQ